MPDQPDPESKSEPESAQPCPAGPEQSAEDTDAAWGDRPVPNDDDRYYQDRPPHW